MGHEKDFEQRLESKGLTRRDFMKFCTLVSATMGLGSSFVPRIAEALASQTAAGCLAVACGMPPVARGIAANDLCMDR